VSENKVQEDVVAYEKDEELATQKIILPKATNEPQISALSLKSIKKKKDLEASLSKVHVNPDDLPKETFTLEKLMEYWTFTSEKFFKTGRMLMSSTMNMATPVIEGSLIKIELPNEGSKISFEENKYDLVNFLRKKLNNYDLEIHIEVNESIKIKKAFTIEDKYNLLKEKNPDIDILFKTFDLDLK